MGTVVQDLRYAARTLARTPLFAVMVVVTLALGLGANTAIFSVVYGLLLAPLPYPEPERLVTVWEDHQRRGGPEQEWTGLATTEDWIRGSRAFAGLAAFQDWNPNLTAAGSPEVLVGAEVSDKYFAVLGVEPARGRAFAPAEGEAGAARVAVVSHELWARRFASDPRLLGRALTLDGEPYEVVGVLPPGFRPPLLAAAAEVFRPLRWDPAQDDRGNYYLRVVARLAEDTGIAAARADLERVTAVIAERHPAPYRDVGVRVVPLLETIVGPARRAVLVLLGAVGLVLLIACANVANLLLARASGRSREMAIRAAVGAQRRRVIRQLLTESLLLAAAGGAVGLLVGSWGTSLLRALAPAGVPRIDEVGMSLPVFGFTLGAALLAGLLFGLAPALQASRPDLTGALKEGTGGSGTAVVSARLRQALVVGEVAVALMLLVGGGLLIRSFAGMLRVDPGFSPERLLVAGVALPQTDYAEDARIESFYAELLARLARRPEVLAAGAVSVAPLSGNDTDVSFILEGEPPPEAGKKPAVWYRQATPGYFRALGMPLLRGRGFGPQDRAAAPRVVVVNRTFAERFLPGRNPLGRRVKLGGAGDAPWRTIVGLVGDVKHRGLTQPAEAELYLPQAQTPSGAMTLVVRAAGDPLALAPFVRAELAALDPNLPLAQVTTMEELVADSVASPRFTTALLAAFAGIALLLAAIGIYGVTAFAVAQRRQEIGVRMALGADRGRVVRLVVGQGMVPVLLGVGLGLAGAYALSRTLAALLFEVSPQDPSTFAGVVLLLVGVALLANLLPARSAAAVEPVVALRQA